MNNLERWGTELALAIRRRDAARAEWDAAASKIEELCAKISAEPAGTLYGAGTGEQPAVERNAVGWTVSAPVEKPRNQAAVPMPRPYRPDHQDGGSTFALTPYRPAGQDGGSTFALTPLADAAWAVTEKMPAVVPCPGCGEMAVHVHTADGQVQKVSEIGS